MSMLRSAATVGGLTLISRVLGFVRDQLIAFALGTSFVAEAFFVAQRFPNLFRALFAEGAFNNAFVPLFAKCVEGKGEAKARDFAIEVFSFLLAWLIVFSAAAMIAMPVVIYVIAPGFKASGETFRLAVDLTRICFPYLLFMSLTALQSGVLNSLNRFTAAAAAPILLNVVMIASNVVAWILATGNTPETGYIFAWGLFASGIAQYALLAIACRRAGMRLVPRWPRLTPDVKRVIKLSIPGIVSGGVMQINLVVATMIATTLPGAVAFLYYADRLYQLPLGVIGVAIGVVLLPDLSRRLRAGDETGALNSQNRALELSMFLTIPAAIALMAIPHPIIHTVFEHGAFDRADTFAVAPALLAFASGLVAFSLSKVFQPGFYAREDTKTPMRFAVISVVVNVVGSILLSRFMGHVGIALATSLAAWTNTILLGVTLSRRGLFTLDERSRHRLPRIVASGLGMGGLLLAGAWVLQGNYAEHAGFLAAAWGLAVLVSGGIISYFLLAHVSGAMRYGEIKSMLKR
ncbi:MAG: murein biosynthesis integral membrane protein MurJ [Alphaproteobacteria bacterium]|uniref:murein biosynthesis integral membrane protein MurJ n=1 Tax=Aestuariivirga sp. TaxID=2650926 RepID=UPI0030187BE1|nr:murein biosynthesis integral membrane protein MurJ [Alphaproteobacteria bacterium]